MEASFSRICTPAVASRSFTSGAASANSLRTCARALATFWPLTQTENWSAPTASTAATAAAIAAMRALRDSRRLSDRGFRRGAQGKAAGGLREEGGQRRAVGGKVGRREPPREAGSVVSPGMAPAREAGGSPTAKTGGSGPSPAASPTAERMSAGESASAAGNCRAARTPPPETLIRRMSEKAERSSASSGTFPEAADRRAAWSVTTRSTRIPAAWNASTVFSTRDRLEATARKVSGVSGEAGSRSDRISSSSIGRFPSSSARWMARARVQVGHRELHRPQVRERRRKGDHRPGKGVARERRRAARRRGRRGRPAPRTARGRGRRPPRRPAGREARRPARRRAAGPWKRRCRSSTWHLFQKSSISALGAASDPTILRLAFFAFFASMSKSVPTRPSNGFRIERWKVTVAMPGRQEPSRSPPCLPRGSPRSFPGGGGRAACSPGPRRKASRCRSGLPGWESPGEGTGIRRNSNSPEPVADSSLPEPLHRASARRTESPAPEAEKTGRGKSSEEIPARVARPRLGLQKAGERRMSATALPRTARRCDGSQRNSPVHSQEAVISSRSGSARPPPKETVAFSSRIPRGKTRRALSAERRMPRDSRAGVTRPEHGLARKGERDGQQEPADEEGGAQRVNGQPPGGSAATAAQGPSLRSSGTGGGAPGTGGGASPGILPASPLAGSAATEQPELSSDVEVRVVGVGDVEVAGARGHVVGPGPEVERLLAETARTRPGCNPRRSASRTTRSPVPTDTG